MKADNEKSKEELAHSSLNSNSISDRYGLDQLGDLLEQVSKCVTCGKVSYTTDMSQGMDNRYFCNSKCMIKFYA